MENNNKLIEFKKKENIKNKIKKVFILVSSLIMSFLGFTNIVYARNVDSAHIYLVGDCGSLLTYKGSPIKVSYVEYTEGGVHYPAYCLDASKPGAETQEYTVSVSGAINDVRLWRRIINGYPYKTIEELGVANKEEAFTATKQAVYCYLYNHNPNDYGAIGEAGQRTLNAFRKIINDAENSSETKISSTVTISKNNDEWKQDELDKNYVSKTYSVNAGAEISNYKINITKEDGSTLEGVKLTDENNQEKTEFMPDEKFKILLPIKTLTEDGKINLTVEAQVKTKPVLYGTAPNSSYQDYALTAATYEDGTGNISDLYFKNETKIVVVKKDQESGEILQGVEFELLDENKNIVYTDLKTNEDGKIEISNLVPGTYYLKETKTIDGYELYDQLIRVDTKLNQEVTVTVNNRKEDVPEIETKEQTSKEIKSLEVKKLPVTGM